MQDDPKEIARRVRALKAKFPDATEDEIFAFLDADTQQGTQRTLGTTAADASVVSPRTPSAPPAPTTTAGQGFGAGLIKGVPFGTDLSSLAARGIARLKGRSSEEAANVGDRMRGMLNTAASEHPVAAFAGGAANPVSWYLGGKAAQMVGVPAKGAGFLRQLASGVGTGASLGTLYGAGEGDSAGDRLSNAAVGGLAGAVGGAVVPTMAASGRAVGRFFGMRPEMASKELSAKALLEVQRRTGVTAGDAIRHQGALNLPGDVIDINPEFRQIGKDVARESPQAEVALQHHVESRSGPSITGGMSPIKQEALLAAEDALGAQAKDVATAAGKMRANTNLSDTKAFGDLYANNPRNIYDPALTDVLKKARTLIGKSEWRKTMAALNVDQNVNQVMGSSQLVPTIQGVQVYKQALDHVVQSELSKPRPNNAVLLAAQSLIDGLKSTVARVAPREGTEWLAALDASSAQRAVPDALESGAANMTARVSPTQVAQTLPGSPAENLARRSGMANAIRKQAMGTGGDAAFLGSMRSPQNQLKVTAEATDPDAARRYGEVLSALQQVDETNRGQLSSSAGPAPILMSRKRMQAERYGIAGSVGSPKRGVMMTVGSALATKLAELEGQGPKRAADILEGLLRKSATDPAAAAQADAIVAYLQQVGTQRLRGQGRAIGGLASGVGTLFTPSRP